MYCSKYTYDFGHEVLNGDLSLHKMLTRIGVPAARMRCPTCHLELVVVMITAPEQDKEMHSMWAYIYIDQRFYIQQCKHWIEMSMMCVGVCKKEHLGIVGRWRSVHLKMCL